MSPSSLSSIISDADTALGRAVNSSSTWGSTWGSMSVFSSVSTISYASRLGQNRAETASGTFAGITGACHVERVDRASIQGLAARYGGLDMDREASCRGKGAWII
jgi:hypothetical protein